MNDTCDRCGPRGPGDVPRGPRRRALPVQTLHEPAMDGAVRARLDHLARWRARTRTASYIAVPALSRR